MCCSQLRGLARFAILALLAILSTVALKAVSRRADAQELPLVVADRAALKPTEEGPRAALAFEKRYRGNSEASQPVPLEACENIRPLTETFWSKKQVLADFEQYRTAEQLGAIVIVKTEYCCQDSRLCAVTTASLEKKSTPLIGRFRVYAAWIKNSPDHAGGKRNQWDQSVIAEYGFSQGPGARIVVMVPQSDGKLEQSFSTASDLRLSSEDFDRHAGRTPDLERFLAQAVRQATGEEPASSATAETSSAASAPVAPTNRPTSQSPSRSRFGFRRGSR